MLTFLADQNFNGDIVRGLRRRRPEIDILRMQEIGLRGVDDPALLEQAAQMGRVLLTHDVTTITHFAYDRVREGMPVPGVVEVRWSLAIGQAIEEVLLVAELSLDGELEGQVRYIPL